MITLHEDACISEILEVTETKVQLGGYQGVVVEVDRHTGFEGTVIYIPGVTYNMLKKEFKEVLRG